MKRRTGDLCSLKQISKICKQKSSKNPWITTGFSVHWYSVNILSQFRRKDPRRKKQPMMISKKAKKFKQWIYARIEEGPLFSDEVNKTFATIYTTKKKQKQLRRLRKKLNLKTKPRAGRTDSVEWVKP